MFSYAVQVEPNGPPLHYGSRIEVTRRLALEVYENVNRGKMATSAVLLIDRGQIIDRWDGQTWMSGHDERELRSRR
jgi:hypothetical protein